MTKIKLCGLVRTEDALAANAAMPDWAGLVFDEGRHFVSDDAAEAIRRTLHPSIPIVGVFVRDDPEHILRLIRRGVIQVVQLHGGETEEYLKALKARAHCPFIRVVSVKTREDVFNAQNTAAEYLLLDHGRGGTGQSFDWSMIPAMEKPWIIAGGIDLSNLQAALSCDPCGVDISSGAETNGKKDREKMIRLVRMVRNHNK